MDLTVHMEELYPLMVYSMRLDRIRLRLAKMHPPVKPTEVSKRKLKVEKNARVGTYSIHIGIFSLGLMVIIAEILNHKEIQFGA